jgi:hypothetical protein
MSIQELKLQDMDAVDAYQRREESLVAMARFRCHRCPKLPEQYALIRNRRKLTERIRHLQYQASLQHHSYTNSTSNGISAGAI